MDAALALPSQVDPRRAVLRRRVAELADMATSRRVQFGHCRGSACTPRATWASCACPCPACFKVADILRRAALDGCGLDDWIPNAGPQTAFLQCSAFEVLYGGAKGGGKALWIDTPIPTPSGWTTMGALEVGDFVFAADGSPARVVGVSEVMVDRRVYEVVFSDGSVIVADGEHLWETTTQGERAEQRHRTEEARAKRRAGRRAEHQRRREARQATPGKSGGKGKSPRPGLAARNAAVARERRERGALLSGARAGIRTTECILATLRTRSGHTNHSVRCCAPLKLPSIELPVDPYLLGVWLGDGTADAGSITQALEDVAVIERAVARWPGTVVRVKSSRESCGVWSFHGLRTALRRLGVLRNKHIPAAYLRASVEQRLELLRGLMDTDGGLENEGQVGFTTTLPALRHGMTELLATLGIKAMPNEGRATLYGREIGPKWTFKFVHHLPAFTLPRKANGQKREDLNGTHTRRFIVDVRPTRSVPVRCVAIDHPEHLYLAGRQMIPTHNSSSIVAAATRLIEHGGYRGLILRREYPQLMRAVLPATKQWYPRVGGRWYAGAKKWVFPSGAIIELGSADKVDDVEKYQGTEYQFIALDELTLFEESQYLYLISLLRSSEDLPLRMRATSNPGSRGHAWVLKRFAPWLYKPGSDGYEGPYAAPGQILHFHRDEQSDEEKVCSPSAPSALSRTVFPSTVRDTPQLRGTKYEANLNALSRIERRRFRDADWLVRDAAGEFFERGWFTFVGDRPAQVLDRIRYWDLASTPANKATPSSAWTAGVRLSKTADGVYWLEDIVRGQWSPHQVLKTVGATAGTDPDGTRLIIERDPAQAGAFQAAEYQRVLAQFGLQAIPPKGDKLARARPVSASAEAGNIRVVKAPGGLRWHEAFFAEAEQFPEDTKDQIDSLSGAFRILARVEASSGSSAAPVRDRQPEKKSYQGWA